MTREKRGLPLFGVSRKGHRGARGIVVRALKVRDLREELLKGILAYPSEVEEFWSGKVFWV
jgi:hypothetical protein